MHQIVNIDRVLLQRFIKILDSVRVVLQYVETLPQAIVNTSVFRLV